MFDAYRDQLAICLFIVLAKLKHIGSFVRVLIGHVTLANPVAVVAAAAVDRFAWQQTHWAVARFPEDEDCGCHGLTSPHPGARHAWF